MKTQDIAPQLELKLSDLELIIGIELAKEIMPVLQSMLDNAFDKVMLPVVGMTPARNFDVIPSKLEDNFLYHCREDFKHCTSVSNLISAEFSNQHRWLEQKSRENLNVFYDRLRFGSSYTSLYQKFQFSLFNLKGAKNIKLQLHQGIDYRIDLGSVVPKYVCLQKDNTEPYWLRLFKSGENEDKLRDQVNHIILRGLNRLSELCCDSAIPQWMVDFYLNLTFGNLASEALFRQMTGVKFNVIYEKGRYVTEMYDERQESRQLLELCGDCELFTFDEDDFCVVQDNEYTRYLGGYSDILDKETSALFDKYVEVVYWLCYKTDEDSVREIQNWIYVNDITPFGESLAKWKETFLTDYVNTEIADWNDDMQGLLEDFCDIHDQFPYDPIAWLESGVDGTYYLTDKGDEEAVRSITPLLGKIAELIDEKRTKLRGTRYDELNEKIDCYGALLDLFIDKLDLMNYQDTQLVLEMLKDKIKDSELSEWLETISKSVQEFQDFDLNEFKKNITTALNKL